MYKRILQQKDSSLVCTNYTLSIHSVVRLNVDTHVDILSEPADQLRQLPGPCSHQSLLVSLIHPLPELISAVHTSGDVVLVNWREGGGGEREGGRKGGREAERERERERERGGEGERERG